jgi:DNA-binding XRE family transcriptional regulator
MARQHSVANHTAHYGSHGWDGGVPRSADEPDFEALRLKLSRLRAARGLTYDQLAERSGVSRATLVTIETGAHRSRRPTSLSSRGSLETWWRIAKGLDVPLAELLSSLG